MIGIGLGIDWAMRKLLVIGGIFIWGTTTIKNWGDTTTETWG
jgi:hypothetical protein